MPQSFVGWVDYSQAEQDNLRKALALFKNSETRDELGLGMVRDALAEILFPGTSTIQTRLRYFLIVPWIYRDLENKRGINSQNVRDQVRVRELALIEPLLDGDDADGIFGRQAGHAIKRLPSSVYWNGLRTWRIFNADWSQEELHDAWDAVRERKWKVLQPDDAGVALDAVNLWDPRLPDPPPGWPATIDTRLTPQEAEYLKGRIELACKGSLLARFAQTRPPRLDARLPWDAADRLPSELAVSLEQAKAFAIVTNGAALLYCLELCRHSQLPRHREEIDAYQEKMAEWAARAQPELERWTPDELWALLEKCGAGVPAGRADLVFIEAWVRLAHERSPMALADDSEARALVRNREWQLKGRRSRFHSEKALSEWGGASGIAVMDYRWHRVRGLLKDLHEGLARPA